MTDPDGFQMTAEATPSRKDGENDIGVIWGAEEIGAAIGCNARRAHYLLDKGELPGARKIGGRWCISRMRLKEIFG
jgi:hypothetical protein